MGSTDSRGFAGEEALFCKYRTKETDNCTCVSKVKWLSFLAWMCMPALQYHFSFNKSQSLTSVCKEWFAV